METQNTKFEPTSPENLEKIGAFMDKVQETLFNLWDRWQDEKEYEDINDYAKPIRNMLPAGWELTKMNKRPFGFNFQIGTGVNYAIYCNAKQIAWKRLKINS